MVEGNSAGFFEGLSTVGWLGILIWVLFAAWVLLKNKSFIDYDDRFPKLKFWDAFLYEEWHYFAFMIARFFVFVFIIFVITRIMFAI